MLDGRLDLVGFDWVWLASSLLSDVSIMLAISFALPAIIFASLVGDFMVWLTVWAKFCISCINCSKFWGSGVICPSSILPMAILVVSSPSL